MIFLLLFEGAVIAGDAMVLAGLDAAAMATIRAALPMLGRAAIKIGGDKLILGGAAAAGGAVASRAAGKAGRLTAAQVKAVANAMHGFESKVPEIKRLLKELHDKKAVMYPVIDGGLALRVSVRVNGEERIFSTPMNPNTTAPQLIAFFKTCLRCIDGKVEHPWKQFWLWK